MINRELIRIKIVQLTYAYYQNGNRNMETAEKELLFSLSKAYHLYHYLLALIVSVTEEAKKHYDAQCAKARREHTDLPSPRFVDNRFALLLGGCKPLTEFMSQQKQTWQDNIEYVRKLYQRILQSEVYRDYMDAEEVTYEDDRELWRKLYKMFIQEDDDLDAILEEISLYWNDDKEIVDTFVLKTIKRIEPDMAEEDMLLPEYKDEEDKVFACRLFRATILNAEQYQRYMSEASLNWDFNRLAYMDVVIMQIAIAEMVNFANIPLKVTINEFVDLAKIYSTPKSFGYINGMLDNIARHLVETGVVMKELPESPHGRRADRR